MNFLCLYFFRSWIFCCRGDQRLMYFLSCVSFYCTPAYLSAPRLVFMLTCSSSKEILPKAKFYQYVVSLWIAHFIKRTQADFGGNFAAEAKVVSVVCDLFDNGEILWRVVTEWCLCFICFVAPYEYLSTLLPCNHLSHVLYSCCVPVCMPVLNPACVAALQPVCDCAFGQHTEQNKMDTYPAPVKQSLLRFLLLRMRSAFPSC